VAVPADGAGAKLLAEQAESFQAFLARRAAANAK